MWWKSTTGNCPFRVLPTRRMGDLERTMRLTFARMELSRERPPVNPAFINQQERGGLGLAQKDSTNGSSAAA